MAWSALIRAFRRKCDNARLQGGMLLQRDIKRFSILILVCFLTFAGARGQTGGPAGTPELSAKAGIGVSRQVLQPETDLIRQPALHVVAYAYLNTEWRRDAGTLACDSPMSAGENPGPKG